MHTDIYWPSCRHNYQGPVVVFPEIHCDHGTGGNSLDGRQPPAGLRSCCGQQPGRWEGTEGTIPERGLGQIGEWFLYILVSWDTPLESLGNLRNFWIRSWRVRNSEFLGMIFSANVCCCLYFVFLPGGTMISKPLWLLDVHPNGLPHFDDL
jgi:hypothetical protein